MDRMLYVAMTGAKETLRAQTVNNHNLANVSTTGFRADLAAFQSRAVDGSGYASRVYATNASVGWDNTSGALLTDRPRSRRRDQRRRAGSRCRAPTARKPIRAPATCRSIPPAS